MGMRWAVMGKKKRKKKLNVENWCCKSGILLTFFKFLKKRDQQTMYKRWIMTGKLNCTQFFELLKKGEGQDKEQPLDYTGIRYL